VYTDFEDQLGNENPIELPGFGAGTDFERFRAKARQFLKAHEEHLSIHKLRLNEPLTATDVAELERLLLEAGVGTAENVAKAKELSQGLGLFIRSLVGLDREAAKKAFGQFLEGKVPSVNQIEFIDLIINHLTQHGTMEPGLLYESPFTDINPRGPEAVFTPSEVDELVSVLKEIHQRAVA
jgi:type I restriction enzyme R subunit